MNAAAACAALAVIELDAVLVAQTLVSRPLVAGLAVGALTGAPAGAFFGTAFELLTLRDLPVGGCLAWSGTVAAGVATILSASGTSLSMCFVGGIAAGVLHSRLECWERARRAETIDGLIGRGDDGGSLGRALASSIAGHAFMTFAVAGAVAALIGLLDRTLWARAPRLLADGISFAKTAAPWIGYSGIAAWGLRR